MYNEDLVALRILTSMQWSFNGIKKKEHGPTGILMRMNYNKWFIMIQEYFVAGEIKITRISFLLNCTWTVTDIFESFIFDTEESATHLTFISLILHTADLLLTYSEKIWIAHVTGNHFLPETKVTEIDPRNY